MKNIKIINKVTILGYEPHFEKYVTIATIYEDTLEIRPSHGYFYPHPYGKKVKQYAKRNGYIFNNN